MRISSTFLAAVILGACGNQNTHGQAQDSPGVPFGVNVVQDINDYYAFVVKLTTPNINRVDLTNENLVTESCSGVVVSGNTVLTAAHCLCDQYRDPSGWVRSDASRCRHSTVVQFTQESTSRTDWTIGSVDVFPDFQQLFAFDEHQKLQLKASAGDLAVAHFDSKRLPQWITPDCKIAGDTPTVGSQVVLVGYGSRVCSENGTGSNSRFLGINRIARTDDERIRIERTSPDAKEVNALPLFGDSGGPLLSADDLQTILGILSLGHCNQPGEDPKPEYGAYTRLDAKYRNWVVSNASCDSANPDGGGGYIVDAGSTEPPPEQPTCGDGTCGLSETCSTCLADCPPVGPGNGTSSVSSSSVHLSWGSVDCANRYRVKVCSNLSMAPDSCITCDGSAARTCEFARGQGTTVAVDLATLAGATTWYWQVSAIGSPETWSWGPWSAQWSFEVPNGGAGGSGGTGGTGGSNAGTGGGFSTGGTGGTVQSCLQTCSPGLASCGSDLGKVYVCPSDGCLDHATTVLNCSSGLVCNPSSGSCTACGAANQPCCASNPPCTSGTCADGTCVIPTCPATANCSGRTCGPDPVCSVSCGSCGANQTCSASGQCVNLICTPDTSYCFGSELRQCSSDGTASTLVEPCSFGCSNGACQECQADANCFAAEHCTAGTCVADACMQGTEYCSGSDLWLCNANGSGGQFERTCSFGCEAGSCKAQCVDDAGCASDHYCAAGTCQPDVCPEAQVFCSSTTAQSTCNANGSGWTPGQDCASGCNATTGRCSVCTPDCTGKCGGASDGCGGSCPDPGTVNCSSCLDPVKSFAVSACVDSTGRLLLNLDGFVYANSYATPIPDSEVMTGRWRMFVWSDWLGQPGFSGDSLELPLMLVADAPRVAYVQLLASLPAGLCPLADGTGRRHPLRVSNPQDSTLPQSNYDSYAHTWPLLDGHSQTGLVASLPEQKSTADVATWIQNSIAVQHDANGTWSPAAVDAHNDMLGIRTLCSP